MGMTDSGCKFHLFVYVLELLLNALNLVLRGFALVAIQIHRLPPTDVARSYNRRHHFQIPQQFRAGPGWCFLLCLSLRFEKQVGSI
jgi:hypothetical protein